MLRLILLILLVLVLMFFGVIALAGYYLPWWGTVLVVVAMLAFVRYGLPRLVGVGIRKLIVGLLNRFLGQLGAALKGARAQVHSVAIVEPVPEDRWLNEPRRRHATTAQHDGSDEDEMVEPTEPLAFVAIDVTITPKADVNEGWAPQRFALVDRKQAQKSGGGIIGLANAVTHSPVLVELLTAHGDVMPEPSQSGERRSVVSAVLDRDDEPLDVAGEAEEPDTTGPAALMARAVGDEEDGHTREDWSDDEVVDPQVVGEHRVRLTFALPVDVPREVRMIYYMHPVVDLTLPPL